MADCVLKVGAPSAFSESEVSAFIEMAKKGNPANNQTIPKRVPKARLLATISTGAKLSATAAIKVPKITYRDKVFEKAEKPDRTQSFGLELGYVQTGADYRGQGLAGKIVRDILCKLGNEAVFATTGDSAMSRILEKAGFEKIGQSYPAKEFKGDLRLYVHLQQS